MSDMPIEHYRLAALALAVENGLVEHADWFVRLVEHGAGSEAAPAAPTTASPAAAAAPAQAAIASPAPSAPPTRDGKLFSDERTAVIRKAVHDARDIGQHANWNTIAADVNRLDGPKITPAQAQKFWQNLQYRDRLEARKAAA